MTTHAHRGFPAEWVQWLLSQIPWRADRPAVLGLSGLQGSGKSTLAGQLVNAARAAGKQAATLSLDDVYLTAAQRRQLAARIHPMLLTRGPPGSHDLPLLHAVLDALAAGRPTILPRFDKLADDRLPGSDWTPVDQPLDLLVLEGWMLGASAQPAAALASPCNALEREEDPRGHWRHWCNTRLSEDYPAVWRRIDHLVFLQPPGWDVVRGWRGEQEAEQASRQGRAGMQTAELMRFIAHFERVSRQLLATLPDTADSLLVLDDQRRVCAAHTHNTGN